MKAKIYLRNGAIIEADIDALTTTRNAASRNLTAMNWTTPDDWTSKLHTIELAEIIAVVITREQSAVNA